MMRGPRWLPSLTPDGWLLFASFAVRLFAYGMLSVVLGVYLDALGLSAGTIGAIFTAALAGGAAMTALLTSIADRVGRRRVLRLGAMLMALAGVAFAITREPLLLGAAAVVGTISPSGKEVGPFLALEQAMLPITTRDERRTHTFAAYNLVGSAASALGSLVVAIPVVLGAGPLAGYRAMVWAYAASAVLLLLLFSALSSAVEEKSGPVGALVAPAASTSGALRRPRAVIVRLTGLFALDSFAGGFVLQGIVAYWFVLRWRLDLAALGAVFFGANLAAAVSFLAAAPIAPRIGLVRAMVYTHLVANVLVLLVPLAPTAELAVMVWLLRFLFAQIDVPARQSYTMAILQPHERAPAAGLWSVTRTGCAAIAPAFSAATLATPALGVPFLLAGGLKIVYDLSLLALFRNLRPPEEQVAPASGHDVRGS